MGSSGAQQPVSTTTTTSDPWSGAQPHLQATMGAAANLYNSGVGYQPFSGQTQADLQPATLAGINNAYFNASAEPMGSTNLANARGYLNNMVTNEGLSSRLQDLYANAQGTENPYLQSVLAANNQRIGDRINSSMSGAGRYGSGQHTDVMARSLAEMANPILAQDYEARQQRMQDIANQGLQRAGQASQLVPALDEARYTSSDRLMGIGQYLQDRQQQQINQGINYYNALQAQPWEQLARYQGIVAGPGALGGTKITSQTQPQLPTSQRILGGAVAGAGLGSMFGLPGAAAGGLGGGLLGMM